MSKFYVGQEVWRHDVNGDRRGGPSRVTVTKVGRALVTVDVGYGSSEVFRIDTGRTNDAYQYGSLCTDEEHAEHIARSEALARLHALHIRFDMGGYDRHYSPDVLNAVADLLEIAETAPHATEARRVLASAQPAETEETAS